MAESDKTAPAVKLPKRKKKKKKKKNKADAKETSAPTAYDAEALTKSESQEVYPYLYLLDRIFLQMKPLQKLHPQMSTTAPNKRFVCPPPNIQQAGRNKSLFVNFNEVRTCLQRQNETVQWFFELIKNFILRELGTSGYVDEERNMLTFKRRVTKADVQTTLMKFIREYVVCGSCQSTDTRLDRESVTKLLRMHCTTCGATMSVNSFPF